MTIRHSDVCYGTGAGLAAASERWRLPNDRLAGALAVEGALPTVALLTAGLAIVRIDFMGIGASDEAPTGVGAALDALRAAASAGTLCAGAVGWAGGSGCERVCSWRGECDLEPYARGWPRYHLRMSAAWRPIVAVGDGNNAVRLVLVARRQRGQHTAAVLEGEVDPGAADPTDENGGLVVQLKGGLRLH